MGDEDDAQEVLEELDLIKDGKVDLEEMIKIMTSDDLYFS